MGAVPCGRTLLATVWPDILQMLDDCRGTARYRELGVACRRNVSGRGTHGRLPSAGRAPRRSPVAGRRPDRLQRWWDWRQLDDGRLDRLHPRYLDELHELGDLLH